MEILLAVYEDIQKGIVFKLVTLIKKTMENKEYIFKVEYLG